MFEIDDNFLASVGYDLAVLSEEQKAQYKRELTEELNTRLIDRFAPELSEEQVSELEGIQDNIERANGWLNEFHPNYSEMSGFKEMAEAGDRDDAVKFAASTLWMNDAVPSFGELISEELQKYHDELVEKRQMVNKALGLA